MGVRVSTVVFQLNAVALVGPLCMGGIQHL